MRSYNWMIAPLLLVTVACGGSSDPVTTPPDLYAVAPLPGSDATDATWIRQRTIYAVTVDRFRDSDGDGLGDLAGLTDALDAVTTQRVGTLLLDPVAPTAGRDGRRALSAFTTVADDLGGEAAFRALLDAAHDRDLKVVVTLPINHTEIDHPWFQAALAATSGETGKWYRGGTTTACDDIPLATPDLYGSERWTERNGRYWYHRFASTTVDLDLTWPPVVTAITTALRYWLDLGVDGLYFPYAWAWIEDGADCENTPASLAFLERLRDVVDEYAGRAIVVSDHLPDRTPLGQSARALGYVADGRADLVIDPDLTLTLHNLTAEDLVGDLWQTLIKQGGSAVASASGLPDLPRASATHGNLDVATRLMMTVLFTSPQTPLLLYGDELGIGQASSSGGDPRNLALPLYPWSSTTPGYGFSTVEPVVPEPLLIEQGRTFADEQVDDGSILNHTRKLINLRNAHPALHAGTWEPLPLVARDGSGQPAGTVAWLRRQDDDATVTVINTSESRVELQLNAAATGWPVGDLYDLVSGELLRRYNGEAAPEVFLTLPSLGAIVLWVAPQEDRDE